MKQYEQACSNIAKQFQEKYFPETKLEYCVADDVTGVWEIADRFFSVHSMYEYMKYGYTFDEVSAHDEYLINGGKICIRDWRKFK